MADPPRLHIPVAQQSFKRSFEEFGFDLDSPQESNDVNEASNGPGSTSSAAASGSGSGSGSVANGSGNANIGGSERSKRQRSDESNASTSDGGSEYISFSNSEASDSFVSLAGQSGAGPSNLSTVWSPPDLGSHWEDVAMLSASLPSDPSSQPAAEVAREDEEPNSLERTIERFNEFNSNISAIRPSRSRPNSPPPVLPPLSLPTSELEPAESSNSSRSDLVADVRRMDERADIFRDRLRAQRLAQSSASLIRRVVPPPPRLDTSEPTTPPRLSRSPSATRVRFAERVELPEEPIQRTHEGLLPMLERMRGRREREEQQERLHRLQYLNFDALQRIRAQQRTASSSGSTQQGPQNPRSLRGSAPGIDVPGWLDPPSSLDEDLEGVLVDRSEAMNHDEILAREMADRSYALLHGSETRREDSSRPPRLPSPALAQDPDESDFEEILFRGSFADRSRSDNSTLNSSESRASSGSASRPSDRQLATLLGLRQRYFELSERARASSSQDTPSSSQAAALFASRSRSPSPVRAARRVSFLATPPAPLPRSPPISTRAAPRPRPYSGLPADARWAERSQRTEELLSRVNTLTDSVRERRAQMDAESESVWPPPRLRDMNPQEQRLWMERLQSAGAILPAPEAPIANVPAPEPDSDSDSDFDLEIEEIQSEIRRSRGRVLQDENWRADLGRRLAASGSRGGRNVRVPTPPPVLEEIGDIRNVRRDSAESSFEQLMADWTTPAPGLSRLDRYPQAPEDRSSGHRSAPLERTRSPSISPMERFEAYLNREEALHNPPSTSTSDEFVRSTHGDATSPPRLDFRDELLSPPLSTVLPELSPELDQGRRVGFRTQSTSSRHDLSARSQHARRTDPIIRPRPSSSAAVRPSNPGYDPARERHNRSHPFLPPPRPFSTDEVTRHDDDIIHPLLRRRSMTRNTAGRPTTQPASSSRHRPQSTAPRREMVLPEVYLEDNDWMDQSQSVNSDWSPEFESFPLFSASELRRRSMNGAPRRSSPQRTSPSVSRNAVHIAHHPHPLSPISVFDDSPPASFVGRNAAARQSGSSLPTSRSYERPRSSSSASLNSRTASEAYVRSLLGDPPSANFFRDELASSSATSESGSRASDARRPNQIRDPFPRGYGERIPAPGSAEGRRLRSVMGMPSPPPRRRSGLSASTTTAESSRSSAASELDNLIARHRVRRQMMAGDDRADSASSGMSNAAQSGESPPSLPPLPTLDVNLGLEPPMPTESRPRSNMSPSVSRPNEPAVPDLLRGQEQHRQRIRELQERTHNARVEALRSASTLRQRHPPTTTSGDADDVHSSLSRHATRRGAPSANDLHELIRAQRERAVEQLPSLRLGGSNSAAWEEVTSGESENVLVRLNATRAYLRRGRFSAGRAGEAPRIRPFSDFMRDEDFDASYESLLNLENIIGEARPRRTDEATLKAMPKGKYAEWKREGSDERCPICLDDYTPEDDLLKVPGCKHWLHQCCLEQWLQNASTCPVCRGRVGNSAPGPSTQATSARTAHSLMRLGLRHDTMFRRALYTPPEELSQQVQRNLNSARAASPGSSSQPTPPTGPPVPPTSNLRLHIGPAPWARRHPVRRAQSPIPDLEDFSDDDAFDFDTVPMIPPWTGRRIISTQRARSSNSGPSSSTPNAAPSIPAASTTAPIASFTPMPPLPTAPSTPPTTAGPIDLTTPEPAATASGSLEWDPDGMDVDSDDDLYF